jgi:hypothetical protein
MKLYNGSRIYEIRNKETREIYGSPFTYEKTLKECLEILLKFNPNFNKEYDLTYWEINFGGTIDIEDLV